MGTLIHGLLNSIKRREWNVVDWSESSDAIIDNIVTTPGATVRETIHAEGVIDGFVANVTVVGSGTHSALHLGVDGTINVHSFTGTGFAEGVLLRGSGTANLHGVDISVSNQQSIQLVLRHLPQ